MCIPEAPEGMNVEGIDLEVTSKLKAFFRVYSDINIPLLIEDVGSDEGVGYDFCFYVGFGLGLRLMMLNPEYAQALAIAAFPQGGSLAIDELPSVLGIESLPHD